MLSVVKHLTLLNSFHRGFSLINPTLDEYDFFWTDCTNYDSTEIALFHCLTPNGSIKPGKRSRAEFTYHPGNVGTFESFWSFRIDKYNLETLFLLVAHVVEPKVYCLPTHLKMKPTLLGNS